MGSKDLKQAERVVEQSAAARAGWRLINGFRDSATRSMAARLIGNARVALAPVPAIERVRLAGAVILAATATHTALLQFVPSMARPYAPWLRLELIALGLVLIVFAAPIGRDWRASRTRRLIARFRRPGAHG